MVLSASLSIAASTFPYLFGARTLTAAFVPATVGASVALVELAFWFPRRSATAHRLRFIRWFGYIVAMAVVLYSFVGAGGVDPSSRPTLPAWTAYAVLMLGASIYFVANVVSAFSLRSPVARAQARIIAAATLLAFLPSAVWWAGSSGAGWGFSAFVVPPLVFLPLAVAYTMRQFGVSATTHRLRDGLTYALVSAIVLGAYALVVSGLSLIFRAGLPAANPLWFGVVALALALTLEPVRRRIQRLADHTLFRNQQDVDGTLGTFTNELGSAPDLRAIVQTVQEAANSVVQPSAVHVFLYDELNDQFAAFRSESGRASSEIRFAGHGPLAEYFSEHRLPLHIDEGELPAELQPERSKLALLATPLLLPLMGRDRPLGWIALGMPALGQRLLYIRPYLP